MSSYIRIRVCPNPNNFFDEVIPEGGIEALGWRIFLKKISVPATGNDGKEIFVDSKWLYAESDCDEERLSVLVPEKLPAFRQLVQALIGIREVRLSGNVDFPMIYKEFVKEGVTRNIEIYKINIGVEILNLRILAASGKVEFDAAKAEANRALQSVNVAKAELYELSIDIVKHLSDAFFCRSWESFGLAHGADEHSISHLYDVRDSIAKVFGSEENARKILCLDKDEWSRFGKIFNAESVVGGRHNGKHPTPLKPMSMEERSFVMKFAKTMLFAYGSYLDQV